MTELEQKLRAAMHAAVDDEQPPRDLTTRVVRRYRRRTAVMASLGVAASAAVAIAVLPVALPSHGSVPAGAGPSPLRPGHPTSELHGVAMPRGSDVRLLFQAFPGLAWYSTATRRIVPISGVPEGTGGLLERVHGGFLDYVGYHGGPDCCRYSFYYIAPGARAGKRIAYATVAAPSSSADAIWLTRYQSFSAHSLGRAQLTGLDGRPIGRPVTLPAPHDTVVAGVGRYLLLSHLSANELAPVKLWDPTSRRMIGTFSDVDAVSREQIAWGTLCNGCQVHVFDARTGQTSSFAIPRGSLVSHDDGISDAAFSPDGTLLAVRLSYHADQIWRLAVIDLATGRLRMVPGVDLTLTAAGLLGFDWQSGTHRLVLTLPVAGRDKLLQVGYWQPGLARLRLTTAQLPKSDEVVYVQ